MNDYNYSCPGVHFTKLFCSWYKFDGNLIFLQFSLRLSNHNKILYMTLQHTYYVMYKMLWQSLYQHLMNKLHVSNWNWNMMEKSKWNGSLIYIYGDEILISTYQYYYQRFYWSCKEGIFWKILWNFNYFEHSVQQLTSLKWPKSLEDLSSM